MPATYLCYEDAKSVLSWPEAVDALRQGHLLPKADMHDLLFGPENGMLMTRAARIEGKALASKLRVCLITMQHMVYPTPTVLGATLLARPDSKHLVIVGAGVVARNLARAYCALFPA
ncbi:hypothetical protein ACLPHM_02465 [Paenalcaligenes sp. Me131]|uniref:hypothetical protein n=1 Tax=Paenalcaligenes sp. Me131 TaxID=3392636 RepID=UPI003D268150